MTKTVQAESLISAYGAVEGRVQTIASPDPLRFVLHEAIEGREVACSLAPDRKHLIQLAWGRRALVEGWVSRDRETGRPVRIENVSGITLLDDVEPGSLLRAARGIAPAAPGAPLPEETIRRLRDE